MSVVCPRNHKYMIVYRYLDWFSLKKTVSEIYRKAIRTSKRLAGFQDVSICSFRDRKT